MLDVRSWWLEFVEWCREAFGQPRPYPGPKVLSEEISTDGLRTLHLLERHTPGALGTWRIKHRHCPSGSLIFLIDNLADVRRWVKLERRNAKVLKLRYETSELERSLSATGFDRVTHRFGIQWLRHPGDGSTSIKLLCILDANFDRQGGWDSDKEAFECIQRLGRELLELPPVPGLIWQERIWGADWEGWLRQMLIYLGPGHRANIFKRK